MNKVTVIATGGTYTATTTPATVQIPFDSTSGFPKYVRITATAPVWVKVGPAEVSAVSGDLMIQPADSIHLNVSGCGWISYRSASGTAKITITPTEDGRWNYNDPNSIDQLRQILEPYGSNAHVYMPGAGTISGLSSGNWLDSALTTPATVDNPVGGIVDAIGAINATQPTTANKPVLRRGLVNLLTYSGDLTNAVWVKNATASAPSASTGNMPANNDYFYQVIANLVTGSNLTIAVLLSGSGTVDVDYFNTADGSPKGAQSVTLTSTPTLYVSTLTTAAATGSTYIRIGRVGAGWTATSLTFGGALLTPGTLTAQQILDSGGIPLTTSAAASNPSVGKYSWQFDGVNDSLALGSVPFQMSDDHCVIAAVRPDTTGNLTIFEVGQAGSPRVCSIRVNSGVPNVYWIDDAATTKACSMVSSSLGAVCVLAVSKTGNFLEILRNGVAGESATQAFGTTTLTGAVIGARASGVEPFNGIMGTFIAIKGTVSASDRLALMRLVASLTPNAPSF